MQFKSSKYEKVNFFLECPKGTYVPGCTHNCSGRCLNGASCNRTTGKCDQGCESGYTGTFCEKSMSHCRNKL